MPAQEQFVVVRHRIKLLEIFHRILPDPVRLKELVHELL